MSNYNFESSCSVSSSKYNSDAQILSEDENKKFDENVIPAGKILDYLPLIYFLCVAVGLIYIFFF
jgi:hypothetical protein